MTTVQPAVTSVNPAPFQVAHPFSGQRISFERETDALTAAVELAVVAMTVPGRVDGRPVLVAYPNGAIVEINARMLRRPS